MPSRSPPDAANELVRKSLLAIICSSVRCNYTYMRKRSTDTPPPPDPDSRCRVAPVDPVGGGHLACTRAGHRLCSTARPHRGQLDAPAARQPAMTRTSVAPHHLEVAVGVDAFDADTGQQSSLIMSRSRRCLPTAVTASVLNWVFVSPLGRSA